MIIKIINKYIISQIIKCLKDDVAIIRNINLITIKNKNYTDLYLSGERDNIVFNTKIFSFRNEVAIDYLINYKELKKEIETKINNIKIENEPYYNEID